MGQKRKIIFTGGGSGGHVTPGLSLIQKLRDDFEISYIGSHNGVERSLVESEEIRYHAITTGKLRRYLSFQNLLDIFKVIKGIIEAWFYLLRFPRESLIFSTGGFVTVPVVIAGALQGKKIYLHEQTSRAGLANKIAASFSKRVFITFEASKDYFPKEKTTHIGYPLRDEFLTPPKHDWLFENSEKEILMITGGGNGSKLVNDLILENLTSLKEKFNIVHQVGKLQFSDFKKYEDNSYRVFEFFSTKEMSSLMDQSSIVLSRAGAGTVCELMALGKPSIYIPLKIAQKNEQFFNAKEAQEKMGSIVIKEDDFSFETLSRSIEEIRKKERVQRIGENPRDKLVQEIKASFT